MAWLPGEKKRVIMIKKIVVVGPESTGKSSLTQALAGHFQTAHVPEYAREYLLEHGFLDFIVHRKDLKNKISDILSCFDMKKTESDLSEINE